MSMYPLQLIHGIRPPLIVMMTDLSGLIIYLLLMIQLTGLKGIGKELMLEVEVEISEIPYPLHSDPLFY